MIKTSSILGPTPRNLGYFCGNHPCIPLTNMYACSFSSTVECLAYFQVQIPGLTKLRMLYLSHENIKACKILGPTPRNLGYFCGNHPCIPLTNMYACSFSSTVECLAYFQVQIPGLTKLGMLYLSHENIKACKILGPTPRNLGYFCGNHPCIPLTNM
jgi:hypothetical protein